MTPHDSVLADGLEFRYVPHYLVPEMERAGWVNHGKMANHHGEYSTLMSREEKAND